MPAIPYLETPAPGTSELVDAIRARRGGRLLNLDRMLLHSPPFASGWNTFLREVRLNLALDPVRRELAICHIALLNGAAYEFEQHAPEYLAVGGAAESLRRLEQDAEALIDPAWSAAERATLDLTFAMTREIKVAPAVLAAARASLPDERELVELIGVIASYNMVSRFLVATGVTMAGEETP
jgi:alkylhydroperoxidase family enzyme